VTVSVLTNDSDADGDTLTVISTSQGVMTDKEARKMNIGGEVICFVH
jgi:small subunit ribosomal protein S8